MEGTEGELEGGSVGNRVHSVVQMLVRSLLAQQLLAWQLQADLLEQEAFSLTLLAWVLLQMGLEVAPPA